VLIVEDRSGRPNDFAALASALERTLAQERSSHDCPFCVGHEQETPPVVFEIPALDGGWRMRVVPNKYPAVTTTADLPDDMESDLPQPAWGAHEVIIESPRHLRDLTELTLDDLTVWVRVLRERLRHWAADSRMRQAVVFKNVGFAAGASLEHVHSQLVALPYIPDTIENELHGARRYFDRHRRCVFCSLVEEEPRHGKRLVTANGTFVAWCAYAGRQPFETSIVPRTHFARFEELPDSECEALASTIREVIARLKTQLKPLAYNLILHTAPFDTLHEQTYHWHWELVPRSTHSAGFEWGNGAFINPLSPERAAEWLRTAPI